ncbi:hypothetical protein [Psychroserpens ponticola]|uniref:Carboxypeptidase regulatory-like domain-containing protein n=1 Tax=Psychroserpens ponticola TaxID=2932268 RepID=A0ABY7RVG8_9FLAO|nr:hypothetical protein [Psychroserpens ponticola]WCO00256.1 hypothetical protein MUN68_009230 [Psychroserpens ponticola]
MKNYFTITFLIVSLFTFAQSPQGISYQAVAFDTNGNPVVNGNIGIRISILDNSATGTLVYEESHIKTTNSQGLFNLNIGQGTSNSGSFSEINWGINSKFLKVEVDPNGGTNYSIIGTNQLMSVPYALYSESVNISSLPQSIKAKSNTSEIIVVYTDTNAYGFYGDGNWSSTALNGNPIGAIATDNTIVVYTDTNAYGFYGSGNWSSTSLNGNPINAVASNETIAVYTDTNAYGFYGSGNWSSTSLNGNPINAVASNETIAVYTDTNAYGFYGSGNWSPTSLNGNPIGAVSSMNTIAIYTDSNAYGFYGSGNWSSTSLNGNPINGISK